MPIQSSLEVSFLRELLSSITAADERAVLGAACSSSVKISAQLRDSASSCATDTASKNAFGDTQLAADLDADDVLRAEFKATGMVRVLSSEERPHEEVANHDAQLSVAFDPLDGSSILPTNFAVGTIVGVWRSPSLVSASGDQLVASAATVYGPRTTLFMTCRQWGCVYQVSLRPNLPDIDESPVTRVDRLREGKLFAPANLRATADLAGYQRLVSFYMGERYTLRYTGGMVPDVTQLLVKGYGVFLSPVSPNAPAKLRLVYEAVPMAALIEAAGGASSDGRSSLLKVVIEHTEQRTAVCVGSSAEVKRFEQFCGRCRSDVTSQS